jgi:hypothetical protein
LRLRSHIKNVGKQPPEQSGKYPVNENDEEEFRRREVSPPSLRGSIVMAGLVPAIHVFSPTNAVRRHARNKSGHDAVFVDRQV